MKKLVLFVLLLPALALAQSGAFGHGTGSLDLSTLLPIIADSSMWTDGSHVHAIKPKDGKSIEADSGKFGALHVTGITILDGDLTMVTTAGEQALFGTGSDAAPELSSVGDPNTGIRFPGSDITTFVQGGAEKVRIDATGNVGIGATGNEALHVYKNTPAANQNVFQVATSDDTSRFAVDEDGDVTADGKVTAANFYIANGYFDSASLMWSSDYTYTIGTTSVGSSNTLAFYVKNLPRIFIENNGNVGLGTTTPQAKLSVVGADGTGTGIHVISSDLNINRTTWAQATDTSSVAIRLDSAANPRIGFAAADGDSARIHVRTDSTEIYSKNALVFDAPAVLIGASNVGVSKIDTVFTAGFVPRWVKFTSGAKSWYSPVYADTTGKW